MRVIVISNMFVDLRFRSMLKNEFDNNILLDVFKPDELISEYSEFKNGKYDLCIVWINLLIEYPEMEEDVIFERCKLEDAVGICKEYLISIKEKAESISLSQIWIQQDQFWRSSWHYFPYQLNKKGIINSLCSLIPEMLPYRCKIIDINDIIAQIGVGQAYDNKKSRRWGNPYTSLLEQAIVKSIKRMSSSTRLMSPKCIILDCDNVLWGGVVGEDGIEGIELGSEGIGLRYQKFQRIILNLYLTGTIVALCSKNDYVDVKQVFQLHTGMILKWNNIVTTKINWLSKVENIIGILEELGIEEKDVLFVDDSKDNTPEVIMEVAKDFPQVRMEHRTGETGLATAVLRGFELAKGDYMACMDADLQHPPVVLKYMYKAMESGADFCIPSRLIPGGDDGGLNWYRKFVSGTARKIGQWMLPCLRQISDPTSGLFMFRREVIAHADLQPIGWKIMVEVLAMGSYKKVIEIPYKFQQRTEGESKLSGKVTLEYLKQLKDLRKRYNKANKYEVEIWSTERMMAE